MGVSREKSLRKIVKLHKVLGEEGTDLLERLLDLNPETRITASQALDHPFFHGSDDAMMTET
jgi:serine/threonine protein kinase